MNQGVSDGGGDAYIDGIHQSETQHLEEARSGLGFLLSGQ